MRTWRLSRRYRPPLHWRQLGVFTEQVRDQAARANFPALALPDRQVGAGADARDEFLKFADWTALENAQGRARASAIAMTRIGRRLRVVDAGDGAVRLPSVAEIDAVPVAALPALVAELGAPRARAATRWRLEEAPVAYDDLLTIEEAARELRTTTDWLSRQKTLPFRVELSPGQVRFSRRGIRRYVAARTGRGE
jgi:hypothetical protein